MSISATFTDTRVDNYLYHTRTKQIVYYSQFTNKWSEIKLFMCEFVPSAARSSIVLANHFRTSQSERTKELYYTNNWHLQWTWNKEKSERLKKIQTQSVPSTVRESAIHCLSTPPIKSNRLLSLLQLRWRKLFRAPKKRCSHFYSGTGCAVRQFTGTHSYSWLERGNAKVPCPECKRVSLVGEDSNTDPTQFKIRRNYNKAAGTN